MLSDHADWPGLLRSIEQSGASEVLAMHGDSHALVRLLLSRGLKAQTLADPQAGEPA